MYSTSTSFHNSIRKHYCAILLLSRRVRDLPSVPSQQMKVDFDVRFAENDTLNATAIQDFNLAPSKKMNGVKENRAMRFKCFAQHATAGLYYWSLLTFDVSTTRFGNETRRFDIFSGPTARPKRGVVGEDQLLAVVMAHRSVGDLPMLHDQP